eukprot:scaffold13_cov241-Pinguiococcus_pyrenoidosus.AAC.5
MPCGWIHWWIPDAASNHACLGALFNFYFTSTRRAQRPRLVKNQKIQNPCVDIAWHHNASTEGRRSRHFCFPFFPSSEWAEFRGSRPQLRARSHRKPEGVAGPTAAAARQTRRRHDTERAALDRFGARALLCGLRPHRPVHGVRVRSLHVFVRSRPAPLGPARVQNSGRRAGADPLDPQLFNAAPRGAPARLGRLGLRHGSHVLGGHRDREPPAGLRRLPRVVLPGPVLAVASAAEAGAQPAAPRIQLLAALQPQDFAQGGPEVRAVLRLGHVVLRVRLPGAELEEGPPAVGTKPGELPKGPARAACAHLPGGHHAQREDAGERQPVRPREQSPGVRLPHLAEDDGLQCVPGGHVQRIGQRRQGLPQRLRLDDRVRGLPRRGARLEARLRPRARHRHWEPGLVPGRQASALRPRALQALRRQRGDRSLPRRALAGEGRAARRVHQGAGLPAVQGGTEPGH